MKCTKNIGAIQDLSVSTAVYSKEIYFYTDLYKKVNKARCSGFSAISFCSKMLFKPLGELEIPRLLGLKPACV